MAWLWVGEQTKKDREGNTTVILRLQSGPFLPFASKTLPLIKFLQEIIHFPGYESM